MVTGRLCSGWKTHNVTPKPFLVTLDGDLWPNVAHRSEDVKYHILTLVSKLFLAVIFNINVFKFLYVYLFYELLCFYLFICNLCLFICNSFCL